MSKAKQADATEDKGGANMARTKHRSPNYPAISLQRAIALADAIHSRDRMAKIPIAVAHDRLKVKRHSGLGNQLIAAMKAYGLLKVDGTGEKREVQLTERAHRIVLKASDRGEMIQKAALEPAINKKLWGKYGPTGLPQNDVLREYLIWDLKFNPDTVASFIKDFSDTVRFAKLADEDIIKTEDDLAEQIQDIEVGDYIQWMSDGVEQFFRPMQVINVVDGHVFVEDSSTGIPMNEATVVGDPAKAIKTPAIAPPVKLPSHQVTRELPITLPSLQVAILRVPCPMTEADYKVLADSLALFKTALTKQPDNRTD